MVALSLVNFLSSYKPRVAEDGETEQPGNHNHARYSILNNGRAWLAVVGNVGWPGFSRVATRKNISPLDDSPAVLPVRLDGCSLAT